MFVGDRTLFQFGVTERRDFKVKARIKVRVKVRNRLSSLDGGTVPLSDQDTPPLSLRVKIGVRGAGAGW